MLLPGAFLSRSAPAAAAAKRYILLESQPGSPILRRFPSFQLTRSGFLSDSCYFSTAYKAKLPRSYLLIPRRSNNYETRNTRLFVVVSQQLLLDSILSILLKVCLISRDSINGGKEIIIVTAT